MPAIDPENVVIEEPVEGSTVPVQYRYVRTMDALYTPIGLRLPPGDGPFPVVLLAFGNGDGGMEWVRKAVHELGYVMDKLLAAGYACAWLQYRTEVELGYNNGGRLVRDIRQGRGLLNRAPLEYEDEISVIEYMKTLPEIDGERVGLVGVSHGGEMIMKLTSEYHGAAVGVASEPANHEFLCLTPDHSATVNPDSGLRDIERMMMTDPSYVRDRIDEQIAKERIATIDTPILVMGRETDELQGIFRLSYDLLAEAGKDAEWVSYDHHRHGYIYPVRGADGAYELDGIQDESIDFVIAYLDRYIGTAG